MKEGKNTDVQCSLDHLVELCGESTCVHNSLMGLMGLLDEKDKHDMWFKAKMISNNECISYVKRWLTSVEHRTLMGNDDDHGVDDNDGVNPDDSVSNVANKHTSKRSACRRTLSTTSSARVKAEAEKAALMARVAALKKLHALEEHQQKLKMEREQLELETLLADSTAKLSVLQAAEMQSVTRASSNGMNSYLSKEGKRVIKPLKQNEPQPKENWSVPPANNPAESNTQLQKATLQQSTRPKVRINSRSKEHTHNSQVNITAQSQPLQISWLHARSAEERQTAIFNAQPVDDSHFGVICNIMQKQNEIT